MSAPPRPGRKRAREFKLGGQPAKQVQQARSSAPAALLDRLAPDLRVPALAAVHSRCSAAERRQLLQLHLRDRTEAALGRGADALRQERAALALDCLRMVYGGSAGVDVLTAAVEGLQQQLLPAPAAGAAAPSPDAPDAPGFLPPPPPGRRTATTATGTTAAAATDAGTDAPLGLGVSMETQTPTGLPQLLLAEALQWTQSPTSSSAAGTSTVSPSMSSIGVGTAAASLEAPTAEIHTQTFDEPAGMAVPAAAASAPVITTTFGSPGSIDAGTSTGGGFASPGSTDAGTSTGTEPLDAWPWSPTGLDAGTQTAGASRGGGGGSGGLSVSVGSGNDDPLAADLLVPSPQAPGPMSASTTESGTSPLRFDDNDSWG